MKYLHRNLRWMLKKYIFVNKPRYFLCLPPPQLRPIFSLKQCFVCVGYLLGGVRKCGTRLPAKRLSRVAFRDEGDDDIS